MHHLRAKRRASPVSFTLAVSSPSTGTQPTATTGDSRAKDRAKTTQNLLISALKITKELSSACPPLREAVGALLTVLEAYKRYPEATEAVETLLLRIKTLNAILKKIQSDFDYPPVLKDRLAALASKLMEVVQAAKEVQAKGWIIRFLNSASYTEKTESWIMTLAWHIRSFVLEGTITLELTVDVHALHTLPEVVEGTNELHEDLDILAHDGPLRKALRPVAEALLHSVSSIHVQCHENTRMEVLATLCSWLQPDHPPLSDRSILWVHALAGSGKSTIALTVADWWDKDELLGASFFCARDGNRSNVNCIFRTIAYQLALRFPAFREQLTKVLEKDPDLYSSTPTRQLERLIVAPLQAVRADAQSPDTFPHVAVVIDALDECTDNGAVSIILKSLALYTGQLTPLKFLITSRPEENMARGFLLQNISDNTQHLALNKIPNDLIRRDISLFLKSRLAAIREYFGLSASWPAPGQIDNLVDLSEHLFIFAALAARHIEDDADEDPESRLTSLLDAGNAAAAKRGTSTSPFPILDALYIHVLENAASHLESELKNRLKLILGTIVLAEQRLTPTTLDDLLGLHAGTVGRVLPVLSAILTLLNGDSISIIHLTFPNFLVDPTRCTDQTFLVRPRIQHSHIAFRCLTLMQALRYNIIEVPSKHYCVLNSEIPDLLARISQHIPPALHYACKYWTRHLCEAEVGEELLKALEEFCKLHLLHWLEVLSLLGCVDGAVDTLQSVQAFLNTQSLRATDVPSLLYDCERTFRAFQPIISTSAVHMYSTIALFAPLDSPIRRLATLHPLVSLVVLAGVVNTWSMSLALHVIDISSGFTTALAFSPDGVHIAWANGNGVIQLFNIYTGVPLQVFEGHANKSVRSLSFSPTGRDLLSGSFDGAVHVWDVTTRAYLHTWRVHSCRVISVAWSPDGTLVASAFNDSTIRVWRVAFPKKTVVLRHTAWIHHVLFAADGYLVSGSWDQTCKVWDTRCLDWDTEADITPSQSLEHDSEVRAVAVSSDSRLVACGLACGEIVLWTKSDGERVRTLPGRSEVISLQFYPNGLLAATYRSSSFVLWDVQTAAPRLARTIRNGRAQAAAFGSDGSHMAHVTDNHLHIHLGPSEFERNALGTISTTVLGDPQTSLRAVATSPTGRVILAVYDNQLQIYQVSAGRFVRTIDHPSESTTITAVWSPTGSLFACTGKGHTVHVWKAETGEHVGTISGHAKHVTGVIFTRDEQQVLSASLDGTIRRAKIWQNGKRMSSEVLYQFGGGWISALAVSSHGQWMLSAISRSGSPPDTSSADLLAEPSRQPIGNRGFYFTLRLHDTTTGRVVWIEHHSSSITSVTISEDCTRALAGTHKGEVFLYDLTQVILRDPAAPCSPPPLAVPEHKLSVGGIDRPIERISFSPNGQAVITCRTYTSIPSELQPLTTGPAQPPSTTTYFYEDDWLWNISLDSVPRRLCWIPPLLRPNMNVESFQTASGQLMAYMATQGSLVVMMFHPRADDVI